MKVCWSLGNLFANTNTLIASFARVCPGPPLYCHGGCLPTSIHFPGSQGLSPVQFIVHTWVCHSEDGEERAWRKPGISVGTSPTQHTSLFALSSWFNDLIQGREGAEGAVLFQIPKEAPDISCFPWHERSRHQAVIFKVWANLGREGEQHLPQLPWLYSGSCLEQSGQRGPKWALESCSLEGLQIAWPCPQVLTWCYLDER